MHHTKQKLKENLFSGVDEEGDDSDGSVSRTGDACVKRKQKCPLLYHFVCDTNLSASVFRYMIIKSLLTGKGIDGGVGNGNGVKYFLDRRVGSRSELHHLKRANTKKSCGVIRSVQLEDLFEKQLGSKKRDDSEYSFELYVAFGNPQYDDELIGESHMSGEENE